MPYIGFTGEAMCRPNKPEITMSKFDCIPSVFEAIVITAEALDQDGVVIVRGIEVDVYIEDWGMSVAFDYNDEQIVLAFCSGSWGRLRP